MGIYGTEDYNTISSVEITEITQLEKTLDPSIQSTVTEGGLDEAVVVIDKIIAVGEKIWKIIEKGRPVVSQKYQSVSAIPEGVKTWQELENWSAPQVRVYKMDYKNGYGMKVISFAYRVVYTFGGSVKGQGQYLSAVTIEPATLNVAWGYKFDASGQVLNVSNAGTKELPMAAMEIRLDWSVDTVMKHMQESTRFYVRGDGLFSNHSNGNMPSLR